MIVFVLATILYYVLWLYLWILWSRIILEFATSVSRTWRPRAALLVIANVVYTVTDPPVLALRRRVRPISIGSIALDLAFTIVMVAVIILINVVGSVRAYAFYL